jgi:hypothetical protein
MNKHRTRRAKRHRYHLPNFVALFRYMLDCRAFVSLSAWARAALIEVIRGYNGSNNGRIVLSVRNLAKRLGCDKDTANDALQELTDKGFIEPTIKGAFHVKFKRATEWRLNDRRCNATGVPQSQAFLKWRGSDSVRKKQSGKNDQKQRAAETIKPWIAAGMSRATWFRRRNRETETVRRSDRTGPYGPTEPDTTSLIETRETVRQNRTLLYLPCEESPLMQH